MMNDEQKSILQYKRAQKRVKEVKDFYNHLLVYIIINIPLLVFKFNIHLITIESKILGHPEFFTWIYWNAILWGIGILIHAAYVFKYNPFFGKKWEERQIKKYMEEDKLEGKKNRYKET